MNLRKPVTDSHPMRDHLNPGDRTGASSSTHGAALLLQRDDFAAQSYSNDALLSAPSSPCGKRKRRPAGTPDPDAEVVALSPKTLMESDKYVCEICNQGFQRDQNLQMHRRRHKVPWKLIKRNNPDVQKRVFICPEPACLHHDPCHALGDLIGIKKHFRRKHSNEKRWKCEKCSKGYAVQSDYKAHLKTCGTRGHCCACGRVFSRVNSFIEHQDTCNAANKKAALRGSEQTSVHLAEIKSTASTNCSYEDPTLPSHDPSQRNQMTSFTIKNDNNLNVTSVQRELQFLPVKNLSTETSDSVIPESDNCKGRSILIGKVMACANYDISSLYSGAPASSKERHLSLLDDSDKKVSSSLELSIGPCVFASQSNQNEINPKIASTDPGSGLMLNTSKARLIRNEPPTTRQLENDLFLSTSIYAANMQEHPDLMRVNRFSEFAIGGSRKVINEPKYALPTKTWMLTPRTETAKNEINVQAEGHGGCFHSILLDNTGIQKYRLARPQKRRLFNTEQILSQDNVTRSERGSYESTSQYRMFSPEEFKDSWSEPPFGTQMNAHYSLEAQSYYEDANGSLQLKETNNASEVKIAPETDLELASSWRMVMAESECASSSDSHGHILTSKDAPPFKLFLPAASNAFDNGEVLLLSPTTGRQTQLQLPCRFDQ